jgi:hypothetical protein
MANSKRKCKYCGNYKSAPEGIKVPAGWFCGVDHVMEFIKESNAKLKKAVEKANSDIKKQKKASRKALRDFNRRDLRWQHRQTQKAFNKMRVLEELKWFSDRGIQPYCISCGKESMDWCCGHFKTVGAQGGLRYDRMNTYLQCNRYCNMGLSGNIEGNKNTHGYKKGLILRFGEEAGKRIIDYCESNTAPVKLEWESIEGMRKEFNKKIRCLS